MSDRSLYFPVFKGKRAEFFALKELVPSVKAAITPIVELFPLDSDEESELPGSTLSVHLELSAEHLARCWGAMRFLVDARPLKNRTSLAEFCGNARKLSLNAVPVLATRLPSDEIDEGATIIATDGRGACLRERVADVVSDAFAKKLSKTLGRLGLSPGDVDLVVDLDELTDDNAEDARVLAETALRRTPTPNAWRSLVLTSSAFPNLAGMKPGIHTFPRHDWNLWAQIDDVPRRPTFSDHTVIHPKPGKSGAAQYVSAMVRYTSPTEFIVHRGRLLRTYGHEQYAELASALVKSKDVFCGANFSRGDAYLAQLAASKHKGAPAPLLQAGINHHLTFVMRELARPSSS